MNRCSPRLSVCSSSRTCAADEDHCRNPAGNMAVLTSWSEQSRSGASPSSLHLKLLDQPSSGASSFVIAENCVRGMTGTSLAITRHCSGCAPCFVVRDRESGELACASASCRAVKESTDIPNATCRESGQRRTPAGGPCPTADSALTEKAKPVQGHRAYPVRTR